MLLLTTFSNSSSSPVAGSGSSLTATLSLPWMRAALMSRSVVTVVLLGAQLALEAVEGGVAEKVLDGHELDLRAGAGGAVGEVLVHHDEVGVVGDRLDGGVDHADVPPTCLLQLLAEGV